MVIFYTGAILAVVVIIAPTLPRWSANSDDLRQLSSRLVVLALVGVGSAATARRMAREYVQAHMLRAEAERLAELDRLRNDFISSISHDLRTPLTAARAGIGLLQSDMADQMKPENQHIWNNVRRNIERLKILIDDLLDLNHLKAGMMRLERQPIDLRLVVIEALASVITLLEAKRQTVHLDLLMPLHTFGDTCRLEQVVVNLLANAQQHTPPGTQIMIVGRALADTVQLAVHDTGPGIPAAELKAIFLHFHRLGAQGGSGLGLAVAKSIVELHGGRIWAESEVGNGTTVTIALDKASPVSNNTINLAS